MFPFQLVEFSLKLLRKAMLLPQYFGFHGRANVVEVKC